MNKIAVPLCGTAYLILIMTLSGCKTEPVPPVAVLARVGERILSADELAVWEASLGTQKPTPELRTAFIRHWVEEELLVNAALDRGLADDPWVTSKMNDLERRLLTARLIELDAASLPSPTTKEVLDYYQNHMDEFIWNDLHMEIRYWRCANRSSLDQLRNDLQHNRSSALQPGKISEIDSGKFEVNDPMTVYPEIWKYMSWMSEGQLGYPVNIDGAYWMFRIERRDEKGSQQRPVDVAEIITSRMIEESKLGRRSELIRIYAEQSRKDGRLQWVDPSTIPSTERTDED